MGGVNKTELLVIDWLKGERERGSELVGYLRKIAEGETEFEYGDVELGSWIADLIDGTDNAVYWLARLGVQSAAIRDLRQALTEGREDPEGWLGELDPMVIRVFLLQVNGDDLYVHSLFEGFHPGNRYRVEDENTVYEPGWMTSGGRWALGPGNRQVCDEPIGKPCSCRIEQRGRD